MGRRVCETGGKSRWYSYRLSALSRVYANATASDGRAGSRKGANRYPCPGHHNYGDVQNTVFHDGLYIDLSHFIYS